MAPGRTLRAGHVATALFLHSAPSFFVGILALMVFSYQLGWLPPGGMVSLGGPRACGR
jgi:peptide/nickel transport system permease protein